MTARDGISTEALSKAYGEFRALESLDLQIAGGEVVGLLGPNGAGKTTLIRLIMGLLVPSSGRAQVLGMDCFSDRVALKRQIGYLPDTPFSPHPGRADDGPRSLFESPDSPVSAQLRRRRRHRAAQHALARHGRVTLRSRRRSAARAPRCQRRARRALRADKRSSR
jgi:ABC-type Mn2+/Zn2+ transport system ATPase subunit